LIGYKCDVCGYTLIIADEKFDKHHKVFFHLVAAYIKEHIKELPPGPTIQF
jgi:hypothetical protein